MLWKRPHTPLWTQHPSKLMPCFSPLMWNCFKDPQKSPTFCCFPGVLCAPYSIWYLLFFHLGLPLPCSSATSWERHFLTAPSKRVLLLLSATLIQFIILHGTSHNLLFSSHIKMIFFLFLSSKLYYLAQMIKNPPAMQETWVWSFGQEDTLEKGITVHSSILA